MKKSLVASLLMLISVFILGGCSSASYYSRPNTTDAEKEKDYKGCEERAELRYPEKIVYKKSNTTTTECTTKRDKQICTSKTEDVKDDLNYSDRSREKERCMESKGYGYR